MQKKRVSKSTYWYRRKRKPKTKYQRKIRTKKTKTNLHNYKENASSNESSIVAEKIENLMKIRDIYEMKKEINKLVETLKKNKLDNENLSLKLLIGICLHKEFPEEVRICAIEKFLDIDIKHFLKISNKIIIDVKEEPKFIFRITKIIDQRSWDNSVKNVSIKRGRSEDKGIFIDPELFNTFNRREFAENINELYKINQNRAITTECRVLQEHILKDLILKIYPNEISLLKDSNGRTYGHSRLIENLFHNTDFLRVVGMRPTEDDIAFIKNKLVMIKNLGNLDVHNINIYPTNSDIETLKDAVNSVLRILLEIERKID